MSDREVEMLGLLVAYEKWEADLILCHDAWQTSSGLPQMTQELYDRFMELQARRNAIVRPIRANGGAS